MTIAIVSGGNPGYCLRMYEFGTFSDITIKLNTNDLPLFGDIPENYNTFKFVEFGCHVKFDLPGVQTGSVALVHGSPIHTESGLSQDVWHELYWDEATINHAGGIDLTSFIIGVRCAGSGSYPNVPTNIWVDNIYIRIRLEE